MSRLSFILAVAFASATGVCTELATFAGGCFWCMEHPFDTLDGVVSVTVGYTGGEDSTPTYEEVSAGKTGHAEAVQVEFDATRISFEELLKVFWRNIDPTQLNRQFCDVGTQYRTAVFYHSEQQKEIAEASKKKLEADSGIGAFVTEVVPAGVFYPAEEYHQEYYKRNPIRYRIYRGLCGRDGRLEEIWGDESTP